MAKFKSSKAHLVYYVVYEYDDLELNEHFVISNYFQSLGDVSLYIHDLDVECTALDNAFYHCRSNPKIKISLKSIRDRLYVSLFNQNKL